MDNKVLEKPQLKSRKSKVARVLCDLAPETVTSFVFFCHTHTTSREKTTVWGFLCNFTCLNNLNLVKNENFKLNMVDFSKINYKFY